jgi:hypothetical protein
MDYASPSPTLPDEAAAIDALEAWLATAPVDKNSEYYWARREGRLWPAEGR